MNFGLSDDQRALQDALDAFCSEHSSLDKVRHILDGDAGAARALREGLMGLGANAILVPAEQGGLGLGLFEAALMFEVLGRYITPVDLLGNALAALAIQRDGTPKHRAVWLDRLATGETNFGVALSHLAARREGAGIQSHDGRLRGRSVMAFCPSDAGAMLVADDRGALWIVDCAERGVSLRPLNTIDRTRSMAILDLDDAVGDPLFDGDGSGGQARDLLTAARVLIAADLLGCSQRMLEMAVAYASERKQFGVAIATFQAVKHMCAEMAAELEPCRSLMWFAAQVVDRRSPESAVMACHAKSRLADVGQLVARTATEVHGGIGFTEDLGLHLWFKRIGLDRQVLGDPTTLRAEAARLQGWAA